MNKSLYSLMLSDEVVDKIDRLALRNNTNRSNLVNQILAEYVSYVTPEKRIDNILRNIESLLENETALVPFFVPNQLSMALKSSLEYKYRPTIRYTVQLYRMPDESEGEITVNFRTQSQVLHEKITDFIRLFKKLEDMYTLKYFENGAHKYLLSEDKFTRTIAVPKGREYTNEEFGREISSYIKMFDSLLKEWIAPGREMSPRELQGLYEEYFKQGVGLI